MKKYIFFLIIVFSLFTENYQANAQLRPYPVKISADDGDGAGIGGGTGPVVDAYGNPVCCEIGGFSHTLSFSSFANLLTLENKILRAQWAEVKSWLDKQEETFRKEINRQMGKNYSSFATAQREFFKFYDGGRYGNSGVVALANSLLSDNSRWASQNKQRAYDNIIKHHIIDEWIKCGYCDELQDLAYEQGELAKYDKDSSPGPRFYATAESNQSQELFEENRYNYLLNITRKIGLEKMLEDGFLLDELSQWRINDYRNREVKESVFLMSSYLISSSTYCPLVQSTCLPSQLQKYAPQRIGKEILYPWAKQLAPEINGDVVLFTDDYGELPLSYYLNRFYPKRWRTYRTNLTLARDYVRESLDLIEKENEICSGIKWTNLQSGESFNTNLTGLRLIYFDQILGWFEKPVKLPDMCITIPNFNRLSDGREIKIPSHVATTRLKIAWSTAVDLLSVQEDYIKILQLRNPDGATAGPLLVANLNLALADLRGGSKVSLGRCAGSIVSSKVEFCAN